jgi:hypothetical protein
VGLAAAYRFDQTEFPVTEQNVATDGFTETYAIRGQDGSVETMPWDLCLLRLERYAINLHIEMPQVARGTVAAYDTMRILQDALRAEYERTGEQAIAELSPLLVGVEGRTVEVETLDGERRRFVVGKSSGFLPHHIELRHDGLAVRADLEYRRVWVR